MARTRRRRSRAVTRNTVVVTVRGDGTASLTARGPGAPDLRDVAPLVATRRTETSDEEFLRWCQSLKSCRYCGEKFVGPVCPCEYE